MGWGWGGTLEAAVERQREMICKDVRPGKIITSLGANVGLFAKVEFKIKK